MWQHLSRQPIAKSHSAEFSRASLPISHYGDTAVGRTRLRVRNFDQFTPSASSGHLLLECYCLSRIIEDTYGWRCEAPHQQLREVTMITLEDARRIIAAAERKAKELGQPMNIAVADGGGNLVAHVRMDEAWIGSIDISIKKAFTARAFDIATRDLAPLAQPGGDFFGINTSNEGRIMIFAGGIPLRRVGEVVGAIGVSGGSGEQDQVVAEAG